MSDQEKRGYWYFQFDYEGWLQSPEVMRMPMSERGVYIELIANQAKEGKLHAGARLLAKQCRVDERTIQRWLKKWGHLYPIIKLEPDTEVAIWAPSGRQGGSNRQPDIDQVVTKWAPIGDQVGASWMLNGLYRANPKQWNILVKSGKFGVQPLLEEKREEGILDVDKNVDDFVVNDHSRTKLTMSTHRMVTPQARVKKLGFSNG